MMSIASFIMAKSDVRQDQVERATTASRVRLSSVTVSDTLSGTSEDIEASDIWPLVEVKVDFSKMEGTGKNSFLAGLAVSLLMVGLEIFLVSGYAAFVAGQMGVEAVRPAYMDANPGSFAALGLWALVTQTFGGMGGVSWGIVCERTMRTGLAAVNQLASSKPPIVSFRHAGETGTSVPQVCLGAWLRVPSNLDHSLWPACLPV